MRLTIQSKLFFSHFAAIILISGSVGTYFYQSAIDNLTQALRSRLQNSAALVSHGLNVQSLDQIRAMEDMNTAAYKEGVESLRDFVKANPDIAFIYVMRKVGDRAEFVLDSDTDDPAAPGEDYPYDLPALMEGFIRPAVDREITKDRWGSFLSGYSPLDAGKGIYLVGIDMYAGEVESKLKEIRLAGVLSLALSIILAMIFSRFLSLNFTRRISMVTDRLASIAPDQSVEQVDGQGDELSQLSSAFEQMSQRLENSRREIEENQTALRKARDELENRVNERTGELVKANQQLTQEVAERRHMEQRLEQLSQTDYLTGILNRRAISRKLEEEQTTVTAAEESFCIILLDLDHFKEINDQYGHAVGDQALRHAVERLRNGIRDSDLLGRWGGEEFIIVAPRTSLAEAEGLAERLCRSLAGSRITSEGESVEITGSFGVTRYIPGEALDTCLKRTDDALYAAKRQGRNRIIVLSLE
ncbi:MAG: diguanylate cyclase [Candidatus Thiodiazotropha sp.]